MARRRRAEKRELIPDPRYNNDMVAYMINCVMERVNQWQRKLYMVRLRTFKNS